MIISYPFDLAHARITSDLTNKKKHDNITFMKAFITVSNPEGNYLINKHLNMSQDLILLSIIKDAPLHLLV